MQFFKKILKDWLDPAPQAPQGPIGRADDRAWAEPPEPTVGEIFAGWWNGHAVYRERAPRPIWIRDPRAVANEKAALERAKARNETRPPIWFLHNGRD